LDDGLRGVHPARHQPDHQTITNHAQ
jgi:hypothetical protein